MPFIIYADIESLILKKNGPANNPKNSSTTKIGKDISYEYSVSTTWDMITQKTKRTRKKHN